MLYKGEFLYPPRIEHKMQPASIGHFDNGEYVGQLKFNGSNTSVSISSTTAIVKERRAMLKVLAEWQAPPAIGPMPENIEDPALQMLWGITTETLHSWATPDTGSASDLKGYAASAGVVEGVARVLRSINDFGEVQEGDILVCPVTHPSWSPLFSKLKAAVSDIGGTMSHMAIVAREYGMPAVVGTGAATKKIKSGQRIRVDGDRGIVTILDAA